MRRALTCPAALLLLLVWARAGALASPPPPATTVAAAPAPAAVPAPPAPAPEAQEPPPLMAPPATALLAAAPGAVLSPLPPPRPPRTQVRLAVGWTLTALGGAATVAGLVVQPFYKEDLPFTTGLVPILATGAGLVLIGQLLVHARLAPARP